MSITRRISSLPSPNTSLKPNTTSLSISTFLKSCKTIQTLQKIHAHIIQKGCEQDHFLITQFICLCCNSFSHVHVQYATTVFNRVSHPNLYIWNSLIKGYCEKSNFTRTLSIFSRLKQSETVPDSFTFPSLVKACANELAIRQGRGVHGSVVRYGVDMDVFVGSSLIDFYGKCREIECARKVFDLMTERNAVSWTAMIVGYLNFGDLREAKVLFDEMPCRTAASWNAMINGFVRLGDLKNARKVFDEMPEKNVVSFTPLIDGHAKAGDMASARFLFHQAPQKDIVAWTALIAGYTQNGQPNEAVKIFIEMQSENVRPDDHVLVSLIANRE